MSRPARQPPNCPRGSTADAERGGHAAGGLCQLSRPACHRTTPRLAGCRWVPPRRGEGAIHGRKVRALKRKQRAAKVGQIRKTQRLFKTLRCEKECRFYVVATPFCGVDGRGESEPRMVLPPSNEARAG
jgi:hypothetical protein